MGPNCDTNSAKLNSKLLCLLKKIYYQKMKLVFLFQARSDPCKFDAEFPVEYGRTFFQSSAGNITSLKCSMGNVTRCLDHFLNNWLFTIMKIDPIA